MASPVEEEAAPGTALVKLGFARATAFALAIALEVEVVMETPSALHLSRLNLLPGSRRVSTNVFPVLAVSLLADSECQMVTVL